VSIRISGDELAGPDLDSLRRGDDQRVFVDEIAPLSPDVAHRMARHDGDHELLLVERLLERGRGTDRVGQDEVAQVTRVPPQLLDGFDQVSVTGPEVDFVSLFGEQDRETRAEAARAQDCTANRILDAHAASIDARSSG
jgi:hypothetical protein